MVAKGDVPLASFIDLLLDAVCVVDKAGRYVHVSAAFERIFGYRPEEVVGRPMIELVVPEDRESTLSAASQIMAGQPNPHFENRYIRKDGGVVHVMWSARWSEDDQVRIAVAHDITARKQAEARQAVVYAISEAAHRANDLPALFHHIHQIIGSVLPARQFTVALREEGCDELSLAYHIDANGDKPADARLATEAIAAEIIHSGLPLLITPEITSLRPDPACPPDGHRTLCWLGIPLSAQDGVIGAVILRRTGCELRYTNADKEFLQFISAQISAAVERQQLYSRLQRMAQYDELTGLANRRLLQDRLKLAFARARRDGSCFALLYLDLDKFKLINDTHGHGVGDLLLREVAERLKRCIRETDTAARIGGDEFVVLLEDIDRLTHAEAVAEKIRSDVTRPLTLGPAALDVDVSIGIAHYPEHGSDEAQLLRHADANMYQEKSGARARPSI
ncbi:diguanylate cyclase [Chitinivorax sp. PXF-14]|uniref:diguanylate cyclase domain-containing protein n=1 Tax=Chitinivorax sp. PXF-14 TaxID=3230488 RepID=UPI003465D403